jgi:hypothetical protein
MGGIRLKERAKTLAEHLSETRRHYKSNLGLEAGKAADPLPKPQISYFEKECTNILHESRASLKNLDKISQLLSDVIHPGVSAFKESLVLSRLSQISEAEAARRHNLDWESEHLEQIVTKLGQKSLPKLESLITSWLIARAQLLQMEKEILDMTDLPNRVDALTDARSNTFSNPIPSLSSVDQTRTKVSNRPLKIKSVENA